MELMLIRHGKAEDVHGQGDYFRELTAKGQVQSRNVARLLLGMRRLPGLVLTSPLVRARQTADGICREAGLDLPLVVPWLACGMRADDALGELTGYCKFDRVALVGHEPDFSMLVECLLGAAGGTVEFRKAALACLWVDPPARLGRLQFLVPPKVLAAVS